MPAVIPWRRRPTRRSGSKRDASGTLRAAPRDPRAIQARSAWPPPCRRSAAAVEASRRHQRQGRARRERQRRRPRGPERTSQSLLVQTELVAHVCLVCPLARECVRYLTRQLQRELTETYSPAAIDSAPRGEAGDPGGDDRGTRRAGSCCAQHKARRRHDDQLTPSGGGEALAGGVVRRLSRSVPRAQKPTSSAPRGSKQRPRLG